MLDASFGPFFIEATGNGGGTSSPSVKDGHFLNCAHTKESEVRQWWWKVKKVEQSRTLLLSLLGAKSVV